jgi:hypothetical protein
LDALKEFLIQSLPKTRGGYSHFLPFGRFAKLLYEMVCLKARPEKDRVLRVEVPMVLRLGNL